MTKQKENLIVDTANLQFQELLKFAKTVGFEFDGKRFVRKHKNKILSTVSVLSFNNMVRIYSSKEPIVYGRARYAQLGKYAFFINNYNEVDRAGDEGFAVLNLIPFYMEDLAEAHANKEYVSLKLQMNRRGELSVMNQFVQFVEPLNAQEFSEFIESLEPVPEVATA